MVAKKSSAAATKTKRLTDAQVYALAEEYEEAQRQEGIFSKAKKAAQTKITTELARRKTRSLSRTSDGLTVTFVQSESVVYDEDGLWSDMSVEQRRHCFDLMINLNALSPKRRRELLKLLTKEERREVSSRVLNVDKMSQAVQADLVDSKVVARHSSIKKASPYIRISHGSGQE